MRDWKGKGSVSDKGLKDNPVLLGRSFKKIRVGHKNCVISIFKYLEGKCKGGNE